MIVWLTGRSGAGKSTIARALCAKMRARGLRTALLDTDGGMPGLYDHPALRPDSRLDIRCKTCVLIRRLVMFALRAFGDNDVVVCVAASPYADQRLDARKALADAGFVEVCVSCDLGSLRLRDAHGYYSHNISEERRDEIELYEDGVSDFMVDTTTESVSETVAQLVDFLEKGVVDSVLAR